MGKRNLEKGRYFELKVRKYLEEDGWIVTKCQNNVDVEQRKLSMAKPGPFKRTSTGFPDFIIYRKIESVLDNVNGIKTYRVWAVEVKTNGLLSKDEKKKCEILLQQEIYEKILIAKRGKKRGEIVFKEFRLTKSGDNVGNTF